MNINIENLVRENIRQLKPYSSARQEFSGDADILLDANENPFGSPLNVNYNRYPDPNQTELKKMLSEINHISPDHIAVENGSDMLIDHICRIFCIPGKDNIIVLPPTFTMYEVAAHTNGNEVREVPLDQDFKMNTQKILSVADENTKVIFLCSPNNPTANNMNRDEMEKLINQFNGIVVVDEAYNSFSNQKSFIPDLPKFNNLIVLQTLSKAWGLAGLRVGIAYTSTLIAGYLNKVKTPYNLNVASQQFAIEALAQTDKVNAWISETKEQRNILSEALKSFDFVETVFPSETNFILVRVKDADRLYHYLISKKIIVRNQSHKVLLANCLRISIGTPDENKQLIDVLKKF